MLTLFGLGTAAVVATNVGFLINAKRLFEDQTQLAVGLVREGSQGLRSSGGPPAVLGPKPPPARRSGFCTTLPEGSGDRVAAVQIRPPGSIIHLALGDPAMLRIRRFSRPDVPVVLPDLDGGAVAQLSVPRDRSRIPWQLAINARQKVKSCGGGA